MFKSDQDSINEIAAYVLNNKELQILAAQENWEKLFQALYENPPSLDYKYSGWYFEILYRFFLKLDNFNILKCVSIVPNFAFWRSGSLTEIEIPDNVTNIGYRAFCACIALRSFNISENLKYLGDKIFDGSQNLTSLTFKGTKAQWRAIIKRPQWGAGSAISTIHCIDGDLERNVKQ